MANKKKLWIYAIPLVIGIIAIFKITKGQSKSSFMGGDESSPSTGQGSSSSGKATFPLSKGSKGAKVTELQQAIGVENLPKYGADGDFGSETEAALLSVLGKKTVDSQSDIDKIVTIRSNAAATAEKKAQTQAADSSRIDLAKKFIAAFKRGDSFQAITDTAVRKGVYEPVSKRFIDEDVSSTVKKGAVITPNRIEMASNGWLYLIGSKTSSWGGLSIKIDSTSYVRVSPFALTLK